MTAALAGPCPFLPFSIDGLSSPGTFRLQVWLEGTAETCPAPRFSLVGEAVCSPASFPRGLCSLLSLAVERLGTFCVFSGWGVIWTTWRRKQQPTPVFLLGKPRGQRTLAGYSLAESMGVIESRTNRASEHACGQTAVGYSAQTY